MGVGNPADYMGLYAKKVVREGELVDTFVAEKWSKIEAINKGGYVVSGIVMEFIPGDLSDTLEDVNVRFRVKGKRGEYVLRAQDLYCLDGQWHFIRTPNRLDYLEGEAALDLMLIFKRESEVGDAMEWRS